MAPRRARGDVAGLAADRRPRRQRQDRGRQPTGDLSSHVSSPS
jgi:hypothetical protein